MAGVSTGGGLGRLGALFACGSFGGKTDAELLEHFNGGEAAEAAFEALVVRHGPDVMKACRRVLPDPNDAEDAFQATFLVLARRASSGSIGQSESLGPWLHGVALRVARKARVAAARRRKHEGRVADRPVTGTPRSDDLAAAVREEVERLPESLRLPVVLCYLEDMTYRGAARRLRVSEATIRGRLVKARGLLRSRLAGHEAVAFSERLEGTAGPDRPSRVPRALVASTVRCATALAPGGAGLSSLSAAVAELVEGVLTMTLATRSILAAMVLTSLGLAAAGSAALAAKGDDKPPDAQPAVANGEAPRTADGPDKPSHEPLRAQVLTLDAAIERLLRNATADADRLGIPRARADELIANFGLQGTPIIIDQDGQLVPSGRYSFERPAGPRQHDVNVSYPLDASLKRLARSRLAGQTKTVAEAQYLDALRNRIDRLFSTYVDTQEACERHHQAEAALARWDELLDEMRERAGLGQVPAADDDRFENTRQLADLRLREAKAASARMKRALGSFLDLPPKESDRLEVERLHVADWPIPAVESLIGLARQARPDLAAFRMGLMIAAADVEAAAKRATEAEDVYLLHQPYRVEHNSSDDPESKTTYAMGVTVPLPAGNRKQWDLSRAKLNRQQATTRVASRDKSICQEVEERHRHCESHRAGFRSILINLQRHRRASQEADRRYEVGEGTAEDVVNARRDLEASEAQHLNHRVRQRREWLALNTAVGARLFP